MSKQQSISILLAITLFAALYFGGVTIPPPSKEKPTQPLPQASSTAVLDIDNYIAEAKKQLPSDGLQFVLNIENEEKRGNVAAQKINAFKQLAVFWKDSAKNPIIYFHFLEKMARLESSEKSLTFAAHSILRYLPYVQVSEQKVWLANTCRKLFENSLTINPNNDSSTVGLGATYIYGASKAGDDSPMTGILKIRAIAQKDSNNVFAQYMLGIGGVVSGQLDKAVKRFEYVAKAEPNNLEVLFKLAEAYENLGNKMVAIKWYEAILIKSNIPEMKKEIEQRINQLKK